MAGVIVVGTQREVEALARASCGALDLRYGRYEGAGGALDALQHLMGAERDACARALGALADARDDKSRRRAKATLRALKDRLWRELGDSHSAQLERVEHMHSFALPAACPPDALACALSPESVGDDRLPPRLADELAPLRQKIDRRHAREMSAGDLGCLERHTSTVVVNGLLRSAYRDIFATGEAASRDLHYMFGAEPASLNSRLCGYEASAALCAFLGSVKRKGGGGGGERARAALREFAEESAIHLSPDLARETMAEMVAVLESAPARLPPGSPSTFVPADQPGNVAGVWVQPQKKDQGMKTLFVLRVGEGMRLVGDGEDVALEHLGARQGSPRAPTRVIAATGRYVPKYVPKYVPPHRR